MPLYHKILVPRDFSPTSEGALEQAVDLAGRTGAELHLLHADVLHGDPAASRAAEAKAVQVEEIRQRMAGDADHSATIASHTVRDIAPAPAIVRFAEENGVDLITLGTHGRRGVRRILVGSVTEEVVRMAPCDILVHRQDAPPLAGRPILVPVDFSPQSRRALQRGLALAALFGARLQVIHSAHLVPYPTFYGVGIASADALPEMFTEQATEALRSFVSDTAGTSDREVEIVVEVGQPFTKITEYARKAEVGLIVMGRRGMSGLQHALVGSTTDRTLRIAPCAVLVTRLPPDA